MSSKLIFFALIAYGVTGHTIVETASDNGDIAPRIIGGTAALAGEFPGKISIQFTNGTHICGGTLIDATHVLTSASCVTDESGAIIPPNEYRLMGDDLTISLVSGNQNRQLRGATHVFVHPEFNRITYDHNVAVIRVDEGYTESLTFMPVARPNDSPPVNTQCIVGGWGRVAAGQQSPNFILQRTNAVVISRAVCNSNTSYDGAVRGGMFCAGNIAGGEGTCEWDEGGALMCNNVVFGIVLRSDGCAVANFPTIYADVAVYNNWIDSVLVSDGEIIPTPPTSTPSPGGGSAIIYNSMLIIAGISIAFFK